MFILIGIALFGALVYTFMRGSQQGQGNLTSQQDYLKAQELVSFISNVDKAFTKLRSKGCSENDISFAYTGANGAMGASSRNHPASAPADFSCHIFKPEGAGLVFNIDPEQYQIPYDDIPAAYQYQHDNIWFLFTTASNVGVGTSDNDLMMHFNYIKPGICIAYNKVLGLNDIDYVTNEPTTHVGTANASYRGKTDFCKYVNNSTNGQVRHVWIPR